MSKFSQSQKTKHYASIVSGKAKTKKKSKFSSKEQKSYAQGQLDARRELAKKQATSKRSKNYRG